MPPAPPTGQRPISTGIPSPRAGLPWLIGLRWGAALMGVVGVAWAQLGVGIPLPLTPLIGLFTVQILSNLALWLLRAEGITLGEGAIGAVLILDTLLLTILLSLTGGATNPFTVLYLVQVVLAAVLLGPRWTWGMALVSSMAFALLFLLDQPLAPTAGGAMDHGAMDHGAMGHGAMDHGAPPGSPGYITHLEGMWGAFTLTAALIAFFLVGLTRALREAEGAAGRFQAIALKNAHLADLTTLAAGAAHELGTPLGTIYVASTELARDPTIAGHPHLSEDITLIREEVLRCRAILDSMRPLAVDAAEPVSWLSCAALWRSLIGLFEGRDTPPLRLKGPLPPGAMAVPQASLLRVLTALIQNAMDASPPGEPVFMALRPGEGEIALAIIDRGAGMHPDLIARASAPFFTTKGDAGGMGLGLFLAHTFAAQQGGRLDIASRPGEGTTLTLTLPVQWKEPPP